MLIPFHFRFEHLKSIKYICINITRSGVALSIVLRTASVHYGNIETLTPHSSETSRVISRTMAQKTQFGVRKCPYFH